MDGNIPPNQFRYSLSHVRESTCLQTPPLWLSEARFPDRLEDLEVSGSSGSSGFCPQRGGGHRQRDSNLKNQKMEEVQKRLLAMQKLLESEGMKHISHTTPAATRKGRHSVPASFQSQAGDRLWALTFVFEAFSGAEFVIPQEDLLNSSFSQLGSLKIQCAKLVSACSRNEWPPPVATPSCISAQPQQRQEKKKPRQVVHVWTLNSFQLPQSWPSNGMVWTCMTQG